MLISTLILSFLIGAIIVVDTTLIRDSWADSRSKQASQQALLDAYSELARAQSLISESAYSAGRNQVLTDGVSAGTITGTSVEVQSLIPDSPWFLLTSRVPYGDGAERVVEQLVRDIDSFASYNLFVTEHPVGISGAPVGSIHSNRQLQFYFPDGVYRGSVTSVEGHEFIAVATDANTSMLGIFDSGTDVIDLEEAAQASASMATLRGKAEEDFRFPADREVGLTFYQVGSDQWVRVDLYEPPYVENYSETRSRRVEIGGHYETYTERVPVYVDDFRTVQQPVYTFVPATRTVPVYGDVERTREVPVFDYVDRERQVPVY